MADDSGERLLVAGAVILGAYFGVIKPVIDYFGLSAEDKQALDDISSLPPDENPFSINYQPFLDYYSDSWSDVGMENYFKSLHPAWYEGGSPLQLVSDAEKIRDGFSFFGRDSDSVIATFMQLQSKSDVAFIAAYLYYNYGGDLYSFLKEGGGVLGLWNNGLTDENIAKIVRRINILPETEF
jgi:hypothetical protein